MPDIDIEAARSDPKLANVVYHDWEAASYDDKWSISFDERCIDYARDRFAKIAGTDGWPYGDALEIGAGTGFFLLNLKQAGVLDRGTVTDISPGMVEAALRSANALGFGDTVTGRVVDAEGLPFDDASFDLVVGHAVLHHIPDVDLALREVLRVLRPGGRFVFAGEPTRWGDAVARRLSHATWLAATSLRHVPGLRSWVRPAAELTESSQAAALEWLVDLHTFAPADLRGVAVRAGAIDVDVATEELTAAWFGWPVRTLECALAPDRLGVRWAYFAFNSWKRLMAVDGLAARVVPQALFYNALVTGVRPGEPVRL
ncbi:MAG TPA: class I SAM-dependent methyltransferase [Mycobacteriales bacterium]|nr:class I SAM-dependent methyltransferase [Mycobacteriales bacterium]